VFGGLLISAIYRLLSPALTVEEVTAKFDGKRYPVSGGGGFRSYRKIDQNAYEYEQFDAAGEKLTTVRATMSADGKTRTMHQTGKNARGEAIDVTSYWDKQ